VLAGPAGIDENWQWDISIDGRGKFEADGALPATHGPWSENEPDGSILIFKAGLAHQATFGPLRAAEGASAAGGAILAPMPGKVIAVDVTAGEAVTKGQRLLVLEAMKMEHALTAPFDGTVTELTVAEGQQVQVEALLAKVEKAAD
jgi:3-methylcrotonyl-CoA carboxylase alpha subunit